MSASATNQWLPIQSMPPILKDRHEQGLDIWTTRGGFHDEGSRWTDCYWQDGYWFSHGDHQPIAYSNHATHYMIVTPP